MRRRTSRWSAIHAVRGRGLTVLIEFDAALDRKAIVSFHSTLIKKGYIIAKRPGLNAFRLDPPLIITRGAIDDFISTLSALVDKLEH